MSSSVKIFLILCIYLVDILYIVKSEYKACGVLQAEILDSEGCGEGGTVRKITAKLKKSVGKHRFL